MSRQITQIQDYLQTQGLKLPIETIQIAWTTAQMVMQNGQALIEPEVFLHEHLPDELKQPAHYRDFQALFMALDSACSQNDARVQSAVIYGFSQENQQLIRLAQFGQPLETLLNVNEEQAWHYLAVRTAHSAWANLAENTEKWLEIKELIGEHHRRSAAQLSLPITAEDGRIFGVLHAEFAQTSDLTIEIQAILLGLVLAILPMMQTWFPQE